MDRDAVGQQRALDEAAALLLQIGVIDERWFVDGGTLQVTRDSSSPILARGTLGPSFVLKRASEDDSAMTRLRREALVLAFLEGRTPAGFTARLLRHAPELGLSVISFAEGRDLFATHHDEWEISPARSEAVAERLALLHGLGAEEACDSRADSPWILDAAETLLPERMPAMKPAGEAVLRSIRDEPRFVAALESVRHAWRRDAFIHGDVKWTNLVAASGGGVTLIDWEDAGVGDRFWDVGSFIHGHLEFWLISLPLDVEPDATKAAARGGWDQAVMRQAIGAFWRRYLAASGCADDYERVVQYAGARLAQTAYERNRGSEALDPYALPMLRLGLRLLERPASAAQMLGLVP